MRGLLLILAALGAALLFASAWRPARPLPHILMTERSSAGQAEPEPLRVMAAGKEHLIRLDALIRYGSTPVETLCQEQSQPNGTVVASEPSLDLFCGRTDKPPTSGKPEIALAAASRRLAAGRARPAGEQASIVRDANGLILFAVRTGFSGPSPNFPAYLYEDLGEQARDGRIHEIASELWLAQAEFCAVDAPPKCRILKEKNAARELVNAGRWLNDSGRLLRAARILEAALARAGEDFDPEERFSLRNHTGNAYSYASTFARPEDRLPLMQRAVETYEAALPYADAHAPSFDSAALWQNLGAAYVDRGEITGDKRDFERGIVFYEKSLPLFDRKRDRQSWARSKSNMGEARSRIAAEDRDLAMHEAATRDHDDSIKAFEEGSERLDAGFSRYRLAKALNRKAATADELARRLTDADAGRRGELEAQARAVRNEALTELARASEVMRQAGAKGYLALIENLTAEVRRSLDGGQP